MRGQAIYQEGCAEIDGIYFITSGNFEITQRVRENQIEKDIRLRQDLVMMKNVTKIDKANSGKFFQLKSRQGTDAPRQ